MDHSFFDHQPGLSHYQLLGQGPTIVLVAGATLPLPVWEPLVEPLLAAGFQVLRYDLPGRGHTAAEQLGTDFEAHILQLHDLLTGLPLSPALHIVGLASGALLAAAYAAKHLQRVASVGLLAPDGAATHFTFSERLLSAPVVGELLMGPLAQRILLARVPRYSERADVQDFVRKLLAYALTGPDFRSAVLATVRGFPLHEGEAVYQALAATGIPTRIIWGGEDRITPPLAAPRFMAMFGADALSIIPGVGHLPFVEQPADVAAMLGQFFKAHAVPA
jgi:pimeloyl-ACP methyl ester carboxylesterase